MPLIPNGVIMSHSNVTIHIDAYDGFSATVLESLTFSSGQRDNTWEGENLISVVNFSGGLHARLIGFSTTVGSSYFTGGIGTNPIGMTWDLADNVMSSFTPENKWFQHGGFSTSTTDSFDHPLAEDPSGGSWDYWNGRLFVCSNNGGKAVHRMDGFSSTLVETIDPPNSAISVEFDGQNTVYASLLSVQCFLLSGFSTTVLDSFSGIDTIFGVSWGLRYREGTRRERQSKAHKRSTNRRRRH